MKLAGDLTRPGPPNDGLKVYCLVFGKFSKTSSKAMILETRRRQRAEAEVRCHWRPWAALHGARGCESASQRMQWIGREVTKASGKCGEPIMISCISSGGAGPPRFVNFFQAQ